MNLYFKSKKKKRFVLEPNGSVPLQTIEENLATCFNVYFFNFVIKSKNQLQIKKKGSILAFLGRGVIKFLKLPFRLTSGLLFSLEKISDKISPHPNNPRKKVSNLASGLLIGTSQIFKQLLGAIAGLALEPYKGAKKKGLKGAA